MKVRKEMLTLGLISYTREGAPGETFFLDLNLGQFYVVRPTPFRVGLIISMFRQVAGYRGYGEHNAALQLVASRADLENSEVENVYWHRPYYHKPADAVTLKDWLTEQGIDVEAILSRGE